MSKNLLQIDKPNHEAIARDIVIKYTTGAFVGPEWLVETITFYLEEAWNRSRMKEEFRCDRILKERGGFLLPKPTQNPVSDTV